jgi:hypothetical protein
MDFKRLANRKNASAAGLLALIVGLVVLIVWEYRTYYPGSQDSAFFTIDDGATTFLASYIDNYPPFEKSGKEAVQAHVFICDGKQVVGYLSRYTKHSLDLMAEVKASAGTGHPPPHVGELMNVSTSGTEVKKPGDTKWVTGANSPAGMKITFFNCPDGTHHDEIYP